MLYIEPVTVLSNTELYIIICGLTKEWLCLKCFSESDSFDRCDKTVVGKVIDLRTGWLMVHESC